VLYSTLGPLVSTLGSLEFTSGPLVAFSPQESMLGPLESTLGSLVSTLGPLESTLGSLVTLSPQESTLGPLVSIWTVLCTNSTANIPNTNIATIAARERERDYGRALANLPFILREETISLLRCRFCKQHRLLYLKFCTNRISLFTLVSLISRDICTYIVDSTDII